MSDIDDEDDKPTVVLDLNSLKEEMKDKQEELDDVASELEFSVGPEDEGQAEDEKPPAQKQEVFLFDFNSDYFAKNQDKFPKEFNYTLLTELKQLNQRLQANEIQVVLFNYNAAPKAVNQLTAQIKSKFPQVKSIIIAKNLSPQKAQAHKNSKSGADGYISAPFENQTMTKEIKKVLEV